MTESMVTINSSNVVYDNTWLWRADHDITGEVYNGNNPVATGLIVNGDDVTIYGLAVEHTLGNLVEWYGENGDVYFYQSELPYDAEPSYGTNGYAGYHVDSAVTKHTGHGIAVYSYFRDHIVRVNSGITCPAGPGISFVNSVTVFLNGQGEISHVINEDGNPITGNGQTSYYCQFGPASETS